MGKAGVGQVLPVNISGTRLDQPPGGRGIKKTAVDLAGLHGGFQLMAVHLRSNGKVSYVQPHPAEQFPGQDKSERPCAANPDGLSFKISGLFDGNAFPEKEGVREYVVPLET
ncbi:MAG: hypothetical protein NTY45_12190 [Elusimicrobia bacterium]|nr:hypothetical protein [Elusimicrobiota bacterium]